METGSKISSSQNTKVRDLTLRGVVIGCIGCVIITATSAYVALKMGALPWPIIFAAIVSLFFLKIMGNTNLHEVNVTHTIMSAGAMVAGGIAFTIPGIWMTEGVTPSFIEVLGVSVAGVALGLACSGIMRRHFVEESHLEFPIGEAAAQTLKAGNAGGKVGTKLFGSMGIACVYTALRDGLGAIPALLFSGVSIPGVAFGIYNSPMLLAVGFLVGTASVFAWFAAAVVANFGLVWGASSLGFWDIATGQGIIQSLGMGLMMGCGFAVVIKNIIPTVRSFMNKKSQGGDPNLRTEGRYRCPRTEGRYRCPNSGCDESQKARAGNGASKKAQPGVDSFSAAHSDVDFSLQTDFCATNSRATSSDIGGASGFCIDGGTKRSASRAALGVIAATAASLLICLLLGLGPVASIIVVVLVWATCAMAAMSVGQTGIDPMEVFGLIVLLIVAACAGLAYTKLFFVAGIIAVACGLGGDVMNDFRAGYVLGTRPEPQLIGQAIGGAVGAVVASGVLCALVGAYGVEAFGAGGEFVAAQAAAVAAAVGGMASVPAFAVGIAVGMMLTFMGAPAMMLGLGVYLPFYMSITAFLGALCKVAYDRFVAAQVAKEKALGADFTEARTASADGVEEGAAARKDQLEADGVVIASGLLGGESIVGVVMAFLAFL